MVEVSASAKIAGAALKAAHKDSGKSANSGGGEVKKRARSSEAPDAGSSSASKWIPKAKETEWVVKKPAQKVDQRNGGTPLGKTTAWVQKSEKGTPPKAEEKSEPKPRPPQKLHPKSRSPPPRAPTKEETQSPELTPEKPEMPRYLEDGMDRFEYREQHAQPGQHEQHAFARERDHEGMHGRRERAPTRFDADRRARHGERSPEGFGGDDAKAKGKGRRRLPPAPAFEVVQEVAAQLSRAGKYETMVQLKKSFTVMAEIFDVHASVLPVPSSFKFLDLGAAPGGFSSYFLTDERCERGFACTLQEDLGGFPFLIEDQRLYVRKCDLFTVDKIASPEVNLCTADAQYLRDYIAVGGKYNGTLCNMQMCGIWALTCREFTLGLERLSNGGILIFRFSWRGLDGDEVWYRGLTLKLFSLLYDLFGAVIYFKSEIAHTADETFYVICTGFQKSKYEQGSYHDQLRGAETDLRGAQSEKTLFEIDFMPGITVTEEAEAKILGEMGRIEKMMAIGIAAREWSQTKWSKRMKMEEQGDNPETTKEGSGEEGHATSDLPREIAGHCADHNYYRVQISPRPSAIVKARMLAVPNFRRLCQAHGRVERIWVDQNDDFILVWYSNWYGANQAFHRLRGQLQPWYEQAFKVELVKPNGTVEQMSVENPASPTEFQGVPFVKADTSDDWIGVDPGLKSMEALSRAPQNYNSYQWQANEGYYMDYDEAGYSVMQEPNAYPTHGAYKSYREFSPGGEDIYQTLQRDYSPDGDYQDFRRDFSPESPGGFQNGIRLDRTLPDSWNVDALPFQPGNAAQYEETGQGYPFDAMGLPYPKSNGKKGGKAGGKGGGGKDKNDFKFDVNAPVFRSTSPDSIGAPAPRNPLEAVGMARERYATAGIAEVHVPPIHNPLRPDNPPIDPIIPPVVSNAFRVPRPVGELGISTSSSELRQRKAVPEPDANAAEAETITQFQVPSEWSQDTKPDKETLVRFEGRTKKPKGLAGIRLKDMANIPQDDGYSVTDTLLWYLMRMVCFYCLVRGVQVGFVMYYTSD
jgi:hypothetical protein